MKKKKLPRWSASFLYSGVYCLFFFLFSFWFFWHAHLEIEPHSLTHSLCRPQLSFSHSLSLSGFLLYGCSANNSWNGSKWSRGKRRRDGSDIFWWTRDEWRQTRGKKRKKNRHLKAKGAAEGERNASGGLCWASASCCCCCDGTLALGLMASLWTHSPPIFH